MYKNDTLIRFRSSMNLDERGNIVSNKFRNNNERPKLQWGFPEVKHLSYCTKLHRRISCDICKYDPVDCWPPEGYNYRVVLSHTSVQSQNSTAVCNQIEIVKGQHKICKSPFEVWTCFWSWNISKCGCYLRGSLPLWPGPRSKQLIFISLFSHSSITRCQGRHSASMRHYEQLP